LPGAPSVGSAGARADEAAGVPSGGSTGAPSGGSTGALPGAASGPTSAAFDPASRPPSLQRAGLQARIAIIGLAILAVAAFYGWFDLSRELRALRGEVAQRLGAADTGLVEARARESDLGNALRDAQAKLTLLEARLAESQSQQAALEALYRELAPSREALALTEVEQVLSLASQQLTLAGNVQAALAALQLADSKLASVDRPQFTPLRRALARDMDRLKAVPYVDVAGISLKLDQALAEIDDLPLARDERLPTPPRANAPAEEARWMRLLRDAWGELRALVRIEVSDRPAAPLLTPQENYFLRENLRLRLLAARLALLSRDERAFKTDIGAARDWLARFFDTRSRPVQGVGATLSQLAATPMASEVPDLARSLDAVRTLRAAADRGDLSVPGAPARSGPMPPGARRAPDAGPNGTAGASRPPGAPVVKVPAQPANNAAAPPAPASRP
jgi:uroporphyrin-3 C-methyltransferase